MHICRTCLERRAQWQTQDTILPQYYCSQLCEFVGRDVRFSADLSFAPKVGKVVLEWWEHLVFWAVDVRNTGGSSSQTLRDAVLDTAQKWDSIFTMTRVRSIRDITVFLMDEIEGSLRMEQKWGSGASNQQWIKLLDLYFANYPIWSYEPSFTQQARAFFQRIHACWTSLLVTEQVRTKSFAGRGVKRQLAQCQKDVERFAVDFDAFIKRNQVTIGAKVDDYVQGLGWVHSVVELTILLMQRAQYGKSNAYYKAVEQQMENQAHLWYMWSSEKTRYREDQFSTLIRLLRDYAIAAYNKKRGELVTYERQLIREKGLGMERFIDPVTVAWNAWIETMGSYLGPVTLRQKTAKQVLASAKTLGKALLKTQ